MNYKLKKEFNWFGRIIPAGTVYHQHGEDYWWPSIEGAHIPTMQIDLYTIRCNDEWFQPIPVHIVYLKEHPSLIGNNVDTFWYEIAFSHRLTDSEIRGLKLIESLL